MPTPRRTPPRGLPENVRRKLEVSTAMAWESLVETHVEEATSFVNLLEDYLPLEESLTRYLRELDLSQSMATAIRTRVLLTVDGGAADAASSAGAGTEGDVASNPAGPPPVTELPLQHPVAEDDGEGWRRFMPENVVKGVRERQKKAEQVERIVGLALARSEEALMRTHVENAISFAALLDGHVTLDRAVQTYLGAVLLTGCRAQVVFQRTMARLADVHLPA